MMPRVKEDELAAFFAVLADGLALDGMLTTHEGVTVPFRYVHKRFGYPRRLVVHYNGAVDRTVKPDGVVFQRSSWIDDFPCSVLFLADPALMDKPGLSLGWGQISADQFFAPIAARIARAVAQCVCPDPEGPIVHLGSSAGGFQALCAQVLCDDSVALVNNAQFDWTRYNMSAPVRALASALGYESVADVRTAHPERVSVSGLVKAVGRPLACRYLVNADSTSDMGAQRADYSAIVDGDIAGSRRTCSIVEYTGGSSSANPHDPLPREKFFGQLRRFIADTARP